MIRLLSGQLILSDLGFIPLEELFTKYLDEDVPRVAGYDIPTRGFKWSKLQLMTCETGLFDTISIATDVFRVTGRSDNRVWFYDPETRRTKASCMNDIFGETGQLMGIHPMLHGDCPGYTVGPGCWYRDKGVVSIYHIEVEGGVVFTKSRDREAGVWSGDIEESR